MGGRAQAVVVVLVLERLARLSGVFLPAASGGEPLWHAPYDLAILGLAQHLTKNYCNRRLPGITQRNVLPIASILLWGYNGP